MATMLVPWSSQSCEGDLNINAPNPWEKGTQTTKKMWGTRGWEWSILQQATIANTILVKLGKIGGVKIPLTPFPSRGAGHDPLREGRSERSELQIAIPYSSLGLLSQYPKRGPYSSPGLQVPISCERSLIFLRAAGHNTLKEVLIQVR